MVRELQAVLVACQFLEEVGVLAALLAPMMESNLVAVVDHHSPSSPPEAKVVMVRFASLFSKPKVEWPRRFIIRERRRSAQLRLQELISFLV